MWTRGAALRAPPPSLPHFNLQPRHAGEVFDVVWAVSILNKQNVERNPGGTHDEWRCCLEFQDIPQITGQLELVEKAVAWIGSFSARARAIIVSDIDDDDRR